MEQIHKKQIALRLKPEIIDRLDAVRPHTSFHTRTDMIETACALFVEYLEENIGYAHELEEIPL
jgi:predicted DNA-binding protein